MPTDKPIHATSRPGLIADSPVITAPSSLQRGDMVEVRSPHEILQTLRGDGTLDHLPFMPEMVQYCGKRYRVLRRAEQICIDKVPVPPGQSRVRGFVGRDVVLLADLRCSGLAHGGCNRGCLILWKEAWLKKVSLPMVPRGSEVSGSAQLRAIISQPCAPGVHFCQSSELLEATHHLSHRERIQCCLRAVASGNYGLGEMLWLVAIWVFYRAHRRLVGEFPRGDLLRTPSESLNLQAGEWVEVKSPREIVATLDKLGRNRGLHFTPDMLLRCGRRYEVRSRLMTFVTEGTGAVRSLRDTVILRGAVHCHTYYAFGGCPRREFQYWKEIWLRRVGKSFSAKQEE